MSYKNLSLALKWRLIAQALTSLNYNPFANGEPILILLGLSSFAFSVLVLAGVLPAIVPVIAWCSTAIAYASGVRGLRAVAAGSIALLIRRDPTPLSLLTLRISYKEAAPLFEETLTAFGELKKQLGYTTYDPTNYVKVRTAMSRLNHLIQAMAIQSAHIKTSTLSESDCVGLRNLADGVDAMKAVTAEVEKFVLSADATSSSRLVEMQTSAENAKLRLCQGPKHLDLLDCYFIDLEKQAESNCQSNPT